jgi:glutamyl-tRNA reductase
MQIIQVGLSHKTAPVEIREKLALSETDLPAALRALRLGSNGSTSNALEGAILSTCNRLEVYATVEDATRGQQTIRDCLAKTSGVPGTVLDPHLQVRQGIATVAHLCEVACGLDSMVLGESQIQGQVAQAYRLALCHEVAGTVINALFRTALRAGKRARTETAIARHAVSISHAAVELASQIFDDLAQKSILLIGAGEMAELAAKNLVDHGVGKLVVVNRSADRATRLARQFDGEALAWERMSHALWEADIVISSTAAPHAILGTDIVSTAMHMRRNRFLFIIDIAVPRDVEPAVSKLPNVFLYDIDDLQQVVDANLEQRKREIPRVQAIVDEQVAEFMSWFRALDVVPTIVDLRKHIECIRDTEVQWAMSKLNHLSGQEQNVILALSRRIVNKILHQPTIRLKEHASDRDAYRYVETLRDLFDLSAVKVNVDEGRSND